MRRLFFPLLLGTLTVTAAQAAGHFVDLSKPGALDRLKHDNPAHYRAVRGILENVRRQPGGLVEPWIRVTYKAEDVRYSTILLTSDPPKRHLSFRLDHVLYQTHVTLPRVPVVAEPAIRTR